MAAAEQKKSYEVIKAFKALNTKANRTAIDSTEFYWLENAMPVGSGNLRVTPTYEAVNSIEFSSVVLNFSQCNIKLVDYLIAFLDDGSAEYVNLVTNTKSTLASAGTFSTTGEIRTSEWKNKYFLILDPEKGYYTWDGTNLINIGSVGRIGLTNPGSGYTSAPVITLSAPSAGGKQATAICSITSTAGTVTSLTVSSAGSGYTSFPKLTFSDPPYPGIRATGVVTAISSTGAIVAVAITSPGSGYTSNPTVTLSSGSASISATIDTGSITAIALTDAGSGYTSPPSVTFSGGGGSSAAAVSELVTFAKGALTVNILSGGSGYTSAPTVTITGGGGAGATGTAIIAGGKVTSVIMTNHGSGYTNADNVVVTFSTVGSAVAAVAEGVINENDNVGISSFSGRVWIASGRNVFFTAPASVSDFTSLSAGSITLADSTLHGNITQIISANNFLYIFGEESINVFSDVRVTANGTTLFTNTNISASVGTKRSYAIYPYFRSLLFMNDYGVYALVGSTTTKISDPLDGMIADIDFDEPITSGQVLVNNILCAAFNFKYIGTNGTATETSETYTLNYYTQPDNTLFYGPNLPSVTVGQYVIGSYIPAGTYVTSINYDGTDYYLGINNFVTTSAAAFTETVTFSDSGLFQDRYLQAVFFDKKWFLTSQSYGLGFNQIVASPVGGKSTLYGVGTSDNKLYKLLTNTTNDVYSYVQTALLPMGDPIRTKQALKYGIEASDNYGYPLYVTIDSEEYIGSTTIALSVTSWINIYGSIVSWTNNSAAIVQWTTGQPYYLYKGDAQQWGKYIGMTIETDSPGLIYNTFEFEHELRTRF